jgi:4-hydroxy-3-polyprenylbenzoate decarboxylase
MTESASVQDPGAHRVVLGITGASGAVYAQRAIQALLALGYEVHVGISTAGAATWAYELGEGFDPGAFGSAHLKVHRLDDLFSPLASGSYRHRGMLVLPCSARTLAAIAAGLCDNLLTRAADVTLKERRPLIVVLRESPFSTIHLENMLRVTQAGAIVMPASPGFYHHPRSISDLVDFVVGRALDHLGIPHDVGTRWRDP